MSDAAASTEPLSAVAEALHYFGAHRPDSPRHAAWVALDKFLEGDPDVVLPSEPLAGSQAGSNGPSGSPTSPSGRDSAADNLHVARDEDVADDRGNPGCVDSRKSPAAFRSDGVQPQVGDPIPMFCAACGKPHPGFDATAAWARPYVCECGSAKFEGTVTFRG